MPTSSLQDAASRRFISCLEVMNCNLTLHASRKTPSSSSSSPLLSILGYIHDQCVTRVFLPLSLCITLS